MAFLSDHFARVQRTLLDKGDEAQLAQHPTVVGGARELIVSEFLKAALPNNCAFMTGELIDSLGGRSGQIDVLIIPSLAPRFVLAGDSGIVLADGVIAAIEVKSSIAASRPGTRSQLESAMSTIRRVKERKVICEPWPWEVRSSNGELVRLDSIPASIVAFRGPTQSALLEVMEAYGTSYGVTTLPNSITVLDPGYTLIRDDGWYFTKRNDSPGAQLFASGL